MRIGGQHLVQQSVVQPAVEHQARVVARVEHLGHQVATLRAGDGLLEVPLRLIWPSAHAGGQEAVHHAQIELGIALVVAGIERHHPLQQQAGLGEVGHRVPVVAVGPDPAGPGRAQPVHQLDAIHRQGLDARRQPGLRFVEVVAVVRQFQAEGAPGIVQGAPGKSRGTRLVVDEIAGIGTVQPAAGQQRGRVVGTPCDQAVDHDQVSRHGLGHGARVVVVLHRLIESVGQRPGLGADDLGAAAEQGQQQEQQDADGSWQVRGSLRATPLAL